jgi:adenylyltransferase/sulfurtransferase
LFSLEDVGKLKVTVASDRLGGRSPETAITGHAVFLSDTNALEICRGYDVVVDGTDNFAAKYLLDAICEQFRIPLVYASIFQFEGQLSVFHWQDDPAGPKRYRDLYPAPPPPNAVGNCNEAGVLGVLPGILGVMQANEVIKILTGIGEPLSSKLLTYDALTCRSSVLQLKRRSAELLVEAASVAACSVGETGIEIGTSQLCEWLAERRPLRLIDVRGLDEHADRSIGGDCIPLPKLPEVAAGLPTDVALVFYCQSGLRSRKAIDFMLSMGRTNVFSLTKGMAGVSGEQVEALRNADAL